MSLSGLEQMGYLLRQSDTVQQELQEKKLRKTLEEKTQEQSKQRHLEKSQSVRSTGENEKIEALEHEELNDDSAIFQKKNHPSKVKNKKSHYYNDPSLGGHVDISS